MDIRYNDSTPNRPWGERLLDAPLVTIDLNAYIQLIKSEEAWEKNDRNAITVFKTDTFRVVLIGLHEGAEMPEHTANGVISVQVLDGHLIFRKPDDECEVRKGQMITLHEGIPHSVHAVKETVFLLTMNNVPKQETPPPSAH